MQWKWKPLIPVAAVLAMAAVVGCGSDSGGSDSDGGYSIALIPGQQDNGFYLSMQCGAKQQAAKTNSTVDYQGPNEFEAQQQIPIVNSVAATSPDAALVVPVDESALVPPMEQMKDAGTKIVEVDTATNKEDLAVARVTSDNVQGGEIAAEEVGRQVSGDGSVLAISVSPGVTTNDDRIEGFEEGMKKLPNLKYIGVEYNNHVPAKATQIVNAALASNPDLKAIFTTDYLGAQGAIAAIQAAGKAGDVKIVTFDASEDVVQALKAGNVQAIVSQNPVEQGILGVKEAVKALEGEKTIPEQLVPTKVLTKDNIDDPDSKAYIYSGTC